MDGTLKKVTINNPDEALRELTALKKQGKELKGSLIEKQIGDMVGDVPNIDIALSLLRNKLSAQKTDQVIDMVVDKAAIDPARKEAVRREAAKIVNQDEFKTEEAEVSGLAKVIAGDNQVTTETEITAKKIKTVLNEWEEDDPQSVRSYREERFKAEFMAKTEEENPDLTDKQRQAVKRKAEIVSGLYYSDGGIENQRQTVMETTRDKSPGQVRNSWSDLQAVVGLMKLEPKATDKLIQENTNIESDLTGVKLPYDQFPQVRAYDDLNALISQGSNLSVLKSIQNGGNLLGQTAKTVNRLTNGWIEKGAMKIVGNFASRIGNQAAAEFVKNSMGLLMQNGLKGSLGMILKGVAGTGVKAALGATGAAAGALTGPVGWAVTAAVFVKKLFNKTVGKLLEKLGLSGKKFLEENFGKVGGVIIKGLTALVALPTILLASAGIAIAGPIVIGAIVGLFVVNQYTASSLVSSLVPNVPKCGGFEQDFTKGTVESKCDQSGKVIGVRQCSEENSKLSLNSHCSGNTVCKNGCGMVSVAIILQCHDPKNTPKCLLTPSMGCKSDFFTHSGVCPVNWDSMSKTLQMNLGKGALFNNGKKFWCTRKTASEMLCSGWVLIVNFQKTAGGGHWLVAAATTSIGDIALVDPSSYSEKKFNYWSKVIEGGRAYPTYCLAVRADAI